MLFFLLCIYITFYYIRPFDWMESLQNVPIYRILGIITIVILFLYTLVGKIRPFRFKTDVMMCGFVCAIILSHVSHGWYGGAYSSFIQFLPSLTGYFLVAHALDSKKKAHHFISLLTGLTTFLAFEACLQSIHGVASGSLAPMIQNGYDNGIRIDIPRAIWYGPFHDPNDLGLALVLPIPFLLDRILNRKFLVGILCFPLLLSGIYLTNSRGAMLALIASFFVYFVMRFRSKKGVALGLVLAALLIIFGPSRAGQITHEDSSSYGRVEAWYAGFQMFKSNPVFGVGQGSYTEGADRTAHNSYMLVLAEEGLFGSFFFIGLFFYPLRWAKLNLLQKVESPEEETHRCLLSAAIASLIGLMTSMFFLSRSYILLPFMMIAILTVLINCSSDDQNISEQDQISDGFHWRILAGIVVAEIVGMNLIVKFLL